MISGPKISVPLLCSVVSVGDRMNYPTAGSTAVHDTFACDGEIEHCLNNLSTGGDPQLFNQLMQLMQPHILRLAERALSGRLRVRMAASDLTQETLISATREFPDFRGRTAAEFRAWLTRHFHSRLVDSLRHHRVAAIRRIDREECLADSTLPDERIPPDRSVANREQRIVLLHAIQQLPDELRQIVLLRYRDQLPFEEIASLLMLSTATVWRRWIEALQILKNQLSTSGSCDAACDMQ